MEKHWYDTGNDPQAVALATMEDTLPETEEYASEVQDDISRAVDLLEQLKGDLVYLGENTEEHRKDLYLFADNADQIRDLLKYTPAGDVVKLLRLLT